MFKPLLELAKQFDFDCDSDVGEFVLTKDETDAGVQKMYLWGQSLLENDIYAPYFEWIHNRAMAEVRTKKTPPFQEEEYKIMWFLMAYDELDYKYHWNVWNKVSK
jgi:hypothetical protein